MHSHETLAAHTAQHIKTEIHASVTGEVFIEAQDNKLYVEIFEYDYAVQYSEWTPPESDIIEHVEIEAEFLGTTMHYAITHNGDTIAQGNIDYSREENAGDYDYQIQLKLNNQIDDFLKEVALDCAWHLAELVPALTTAAELQEEAYYAY